MKRKRTGVSLIQPRYACALSFGGVLSSNFALALTVLSPPVLQKKAWLNFREIGPAGSQDMIVNKSGDVVKIVEPITFVWHLQDLSPSCNRRCVRTWLRCYFNVIVLAANEKASPKFSTDYINDIEKWPRTPLKLGEDPKAALAIQMCQDVTRMYQLQPPP